MACQSVFWATFLIEALSITCAGHCGYNEAEAMASISVRINDNLKARAYQELGRLELTPSELIRQVRRYVAEQGQLPFNPEVVTEGYEAPLAGANA